MVAKVTIGCEFEHQQYCHSWLFWLGLWSKVDTAVEEIWRW